MSILLNILKLGGTKSVVEIPTCIAYLNQVWTGKYSKGQSKEWKDFLWWENSRNSIKKQVILRPHELDQELQVASHKSYSIQ